MADVAGSLPKALRALKHEIRLVTPRYRTIRERRFGLRDVARLRSLNIEVGEQVYECSIKSGFVTGSKVQVYFLDNRGLYESPESDSECADKTGKIDCHISFALLDHAALQLMMLLQWIPDIIHCNNWQTALVPYLLKTDDRYKEAFINTRTAMHLYDISYQNIFPSDRADEIGVNPESLKQNDLLEDGSGISFVKAGMSAADLVITASPSFASASKSTEDSSSDLERLISVREDEVHDAPNGVEMSDWDPSTDDYIVQQYSMDNLAEGKAINREALLNMLKLPAELDVPVVAVISRLIDQKGVDLLTEIESELFSLPLQVVILAPEKYRFENILKSWGEKYPDKIAIKLAASEALEHQVIAGADIFLTPLHGEQPGLSQIYCLNYGTIPIVQCSSRLADIITDLTPEKAGAKGLTFDDNNGSELIDALKYALDIYQNQPVWQELRSCCMETDFSWIGVAEKIIGLYQNALSRQPYCE